VAVTYLAGAGLRAAGGKATARLGAR
jgi:hypothetical protein